MNRDKRLPPIEEEQMRLLELAWGLSNEVIARRCGTTVTGAKHRTLRLMRRYNATNRVHLVAIAIKNGLISRERWFEAVNWPLPSPAQIQSLDRLQKGIVNGHILGLNEVQIGLVQGVNGTTISRRRKELAAVLGVPNNASVIVATYLFTIE